MCDVKHFCPCVLYHMKNGLLGLFVPATSFSNFQNCRWRKAGPLSMDYVPLSWSASVFSFVCFFFFTHMPAFPAPRGLNLYEQVIIDQRGLPSVIRADREPCSLISAEVVCTCLLICWWRRWCSLNTQEEEGG